MFEFIQPDTIAQSGGTYRFTYAGGKDINTLPIDTEYTVIYSPGSYYDKWCAVRYRVVPGAGMASYIQAVKQRDLEPDEIAHFEEDTGR